MEAASGTGHAEAPAEGRMSGPLGLEGGGYTPGAVRGVTSNYCCGITYVTFNKYMLLGYLFISLAVD